MKYRLSVHAQDVMNHRGIASQWIEAVLSSPSLTVEKCETEVHFFWYDRSVWKQMPQSGCKSGEATGNYSLF